MSVLESVYVFGCGNFYKKYKEALCREYIILGYVDNYKKITDDGFDIIEPSEVPLGSKLIIMLKNITQSCSVALELVSHQNILYSDIIFGCTKYVDDGIYASFLKDTELSMYGSSTFFIKSPDLSLILDSPESCHGYFECRLDSYDYCLCNGKKDVIIDIGLNIGDAAVYFLKKTNVKKLYGFEPFAASLHLAEKNLSINKIDSNRYELYQYGLSDKNSVESIPFSPRFSRELSVGTDQSERINSSLLRNENYYEVKVECRRAIDELKPIIDRHFDDNLILKCDCQGAELPILCNLNKEGLLRSFEYITMETHRCQLEIADILIKNGFNISKHFESHERGIIYAFRV